MQKLKKYTQINTKKHLLRNKTTQTNVNKHNHAKANVNINKKTLKGKNKRK